MPDQKANVSVLPGAPSLLLKPVNQQLQGWWFRMPRNNLSQNRLWDGPLFSIGQTRDHSRDYSLSQNDEIWHHFLLRNLKVRLFWSLSYCLPAVWACVQPYDSINLVTHQINCTQNEIAYLHWKQLDQHLNCKPVIFQSSLRSFSESLLNKLTYKLKYYLLIEIRTALISHGFEHKVL